MPRKNKTRRLWLHVSGRAPKGVPREEVKGKLLDSIRNGTYELPEGYQFQISYRNKEFDEMKTDSWKNALDWSATSSPGFDRAVIAYIRRWRS